MRRVVVSVGPLTAASANGVATSQSLASAGALTLNGSYASSGVATLPQVRRVGITSAGNDSGLTWTITGTNWLGATVSETLTGSNVGTSQSVLDYATVTSISASAATASTVTAGTTGVASSPWVRLDEYAAPQLGAQCSVSGTVNYTIETSFDDPNDISSNVPLTPSQMTWDGTSTPANSVTATMSVSLQAAPLWARVTLNSGTGSVTATFAQYLAVAR